jgi:phosphatidylglycerol:prolipoprotein diacylglycerol transferase
MNPIAFQIGPVAVHWYGILIVTGILAAAYLSTYTAKLWGEDPQLMWDALVWCVFLGVIGARLYHVVTGQPSTGVDLQYYLQHPLKIFATWEGGLGIYGAVAGGALGLYIVIRRAKRDIWRWMDITVPGLVLAQAIGRWGNFINQELYGQPTDLPWGLYIPPSHRLPGYDIYERFHPIFFYESMWNLATCLVLVYLTWRYRDRLVPGIITCIYFIAYSTIRFLLEFIRLDSATVGGGVITIAQVVALVLIVAFLALMIWRSKVGQRPQATSVSAEEDEGVQAEEAEESESPEVEDETTAGESTPPVEVPAEDDALGTQDDAGEEKEEA